MLKRLKVKILANGPSSYPIFIDSGLMKNIHLWLPKHSENMVIITDTHVQKLFAKKLEATLKKYTKKITLLLFKSGESSKNYKTIQTLMEKMLQKRLGRDTVLLAVGGGVVGDIGGFIAATYMRGIPYIQVPTTLLAMVDSSIGGKTGINTPQGKNLIGAFWQPSQVVTDIDCLTTLPKIHVINGLIEALKMFLTNDKKSFYYAEKHINDILSLKKTILKNIIIRALCVKAAVVTLDEKEKNTRMILNFGHTIGHALEHLTQYKMLHGQAVALGILVEAKISEILGILSRKNFEIICRIFYKLGISNKKLKNFNIDKIIRATKLDKKNRTGKIRYVLLKNIGDVYKKDEQYVHSVSDRIVKKAIIKVSQGLDAVFSNANEKRLNQER